MREALLLSLLLTSGVASAAPLTIDAALTRVEENNPQLEAALAGLDAARTGTGQAASAYLPNVSASGTYTRNQVAAELAFPDFTAGFNMTTDANGNPTLVPAVITPLEVQKKDQLNAQFLVRQGLVVPSAIAGISAARAGARAAEWGTEEARRGLLFGTAELFLGCVALQEAVRVNEAHVATLEEHLRSTELAYQTGTQPELAVTRARLDLRSAELDVARSKRDLQTSKVSLATLMGSTDADFEVERPSVLDALLGGQVAPLEVGSIPLDELPSVQSSEAQAEAARRQHTAAVVGWLPTVMGQFAYNHSNAAGFTGQNGTWAASVSVSVPIFDGGLRVAQIEEAGARRRQAEAQVREAELAAASALAEARADREAATSSLATSLEQVELARKNWEALEVAFSAGAATPLEVADAASNLRRAELGVLAEAVSLISADLHVGRATGAERPILR